MLRGDEIKTNTDRELWRIVTSGYTSLVQWIIVLSTGALIFGLNLLDKTHTDWTTFLLLALFSSFFSIICGIMYAKLNIDYYLYNLERNIKEKHLEFWKVYPDKDFLVEGTKEYRMTIVKRWDEAASKAELKMKRVGGLLEFLFKMCTTLYVYALAMIMLVCYYTFRMQ